MGEAGGRAVGRHSSPNGGAFHFARPMRRYAYLIDRGGAVGQNGGRRSRRAERPTEEAVDTKETARRMLAEFKGESYAFGLGCIGAVGQMAAALGKRALVVANPSAWLAPTVAAVRESLGGAAVEVADTAAGSRPNSPFEDTYRIQEAIEAARPEVVVAVGGGSTIDAVKAAAVLAKLTPGAHDVEPFFGVGKVAERLAAEAMTPVVAVETAASSGAHLTKYSNITDIATGQKKLINDPAITPRAAVFDYAVTASAPRELTVDGAFDGISHNLEVYLGAKGETLGKVEPIALAGIELCVEGVTAAVRDLRDLEARETLGLGTDLGGYSIMTGSTNGGHLTSFSLVDVTTHGRATAVLNPYYIVLFAEAAERQLGRLAEVFARGGHMKGDWKRLSGRELALSVAGALQGLAAGLGLETSLGAFEAFTPAHIERAVAAAKTPQLAMKLQAMPMPMDEKAVDTYMRACLEAAATGDLRAVVTMPA